MSLIREKVVSADEVPEDMTCVCRERPKSYRIVYGICDCGDRIVFNRAADLIVHCDVCKISVVYKPSAKPRRPKWAHMRG